MLGGQTPYVGRTIMKRKAINPGPIGIAARWSEHVRELQKHMSSTIDAASRRKRYDILKHQQSSSCLNFIILGQCDSTNIAAREAVAITLVYPPANGYELKHFLPTFRPRRSRPTKARARHHHAIRRNKRRSDLDRERLQWGEELNQHSVQLRVAREWNIIALYQRYTRRLRNAKEIRTDLSLTFAELYRNEQIHLGAPWTNLHLWQEPSPFIRQGLCGPHGQQTFIHYQSLTTQTEGHRFHIPHRRHIQPHPRLPEQNQSNILHSPLPRKSTFQIIFRTYHQYFFHL